MPITITMADGRTLPLRLAGDSCHTLYLGDTCYESKAVFTAIQVIFPEMIAEK